MKLVVLEGPASRPFYEVFQDRTLIGRAPECDVLVFDAQVSRHHAQILKLGDAYVLESLQQANPAIVNDRIMLTRRPLIDGETFGELLSAGWVTGPLPRMYSVQASGCAPVVRAFDAGATRCDPWDAPWTLASGLRVPAPLGGRLVLEAIAASGGGAVAVPDELLAASAAAVSRMEGIDISPEGGAALAGAGLLLEAGALDPDERVVVFNTGAGWLYRPPAELPGD